MSLQQLPDWTQNFDYSTDPFFSRILQDPEAHPNFSIVDKLIYYKEHRLCIPHNSLQHFLEIHHTSLHGGHIGSRRLKQKISEFYYFPHSSSIVDNYVKACTTCRMVKPRNHLPLGHLGSTDSPTGRWLHIQIDLVTGFPTCNGFDAVLTVIDKFSSRVHFIPTNTTLNTTELLDLLTSRIFNLHGFLDIIQSNWAYLTIKQATDSPKNIIIFLRSTFVVLFRPMRIG